MNPRKSAEFGWMRGSFVGLAAVVVALAACGDDDDAPASVDLGSVDGGPTGTDSGPSGSDGGGTDGGPTGTDAGDVDAGSSVDAGSDVDAGGPCTPGETDCLDDFTTYNCDASGMRVATACEAGFYCSDGACARQACAPSSRFCLPGMERVVGECDARGATIDARPCGLTEGCQDGVCLPCICSPGLTRRCAAGSLTAREVCAQSCVAFTSLISCSADQTCTGSGNCTDQICTPGAPGCDGMGGTRLCNADGLGFGPTTPCDAGSSCDPTTGLCAPQICMPGSATCEMNSRSVCNADGLGTTVTACASGQSCRDAGVCAVRCGDGILGAGETCDDGNTIADDGCNATCAREYPTSCLAWRDSFMAPAVPPSMLYPVDVDGPGPQPERPMYCDMTSNGGGWTLIVAQFEAAPEVDWNRGALPTYDPTLTMGRSFALSTAQIPTHTQTAFGRGTVATFVDYVNFVYTTGEIPVTPVTGLKAGVTYQIHRSASAWYISHDPEVSAPPLPRPGDPPRPYTTCTDSFCDTLTLDQTGGSFYTWSFSKNYRPRAAVRGHGMLGNLSASSDPFAWTVWVR